jgi:hypothetical protein
VAVRKQLYHHEEVRQKIRTSQLINRLHDFINGKIELSPHQVTAALGLIKKTMPDLAAIDATVRGDPTAPIALTLVGSDVHG